MGFFDFLFRKKPTVLRIPESWKEASDEGFELEVIGRPGSRIDHEIIVKDGQKAIKCLRCQKTSYNPSDVEQLYCGYCRVFHSRRKL
jgi:hypothetical protein